MDADLLALILLSEACEEDESSGTSTKKRRRTKQWIKEKEKYSNAKLLKTLKETEPQDFKNYMRMDDATYDHLLEKVKVFIQKQDTVMKESISPDKRLSITLRFLATGNSFADLKFSSAVSEQSIGRIVIETCEAIIKVLKEFIKLPRAAEDWLKIADGFYEKSKFPHCLGALDGKHIQITKPAHSGSFFFNYKKTFSIVLMAIADSNSEFIMVDVGANGRISDGESKPVIPGRGALPYVFVADDAFALRENIMKPFAHTNLSVEEIQYNKCLSSARVKIENAFGILSARFRVLRTTINLQPEKAGIIVLACCYLHNFLRRSSNNNPSTSSEQIAEIAPLEATIQRNANTEAKEIRKKFCETIKDLISSS